MLYNSLLAEKILQNTCVCAVMFQQRTTCMHIGSESNQPLVCFVLALPYFALAIKCKTTLLTL